MIDDGRGLRVSVLLRAQYVLLVYAVRLVVAAIAAYPACAIATKTTGGWPGGDRVLFEPGSLMLMELVRLHRVGLQAWLTQAALVSVLMIPIGIALNAVLLSALASPPSAGASRVSARAVASLRPLSIVWAVYAAVAASTGGLFYLLAEALQGSSSSAQSAPLRDMLWLAAVAVGALVVLAAGVVHDVARAAVVRGGLDAAGALLVAWRSVRSFCWPLLAAWWARAAAGALLVIVELWLLRSAGWLTASGAIWSFVMHQLILLGLVWLRASWLARAMEVTAPLVDSERSAMRVSGSEPEALEEP